MKIVRTYVPLPFSRLLMPLYALGLLWSGCKSEIQSPEVALAKLAPPVVCGAQRTTSVTLTGTGMTPLPIDTLTDNPKVELPQVLLKLRQGASGGGAGEELKVPDDREPPNNHVRWASTEQMSFDIYPAQMSGQDLTSGLYDVAVQNPDGRRATLEGSLSVVPAPVLQKAVPNPVCNAQGEVSFTLSGTGFLQIDGVLPQVRFFSPSDPMGAMGQALATLTAASVADCTALPAPQGVMLSSCKTLTVNVPKTTLAAGSYRLSVVNPKDAGCNTVEDIRVAVVPPPVVDQVMSAAICTAQKDSTIVLTGSGFLVITDNTGKRGPEVSIGDMKFQAVAEMCMPVPDAPGAELCTKLTITVPRGALPVGSYPLSVKNPSPAPCVVAMMLTIESVPPPTLTDVVPKVICSGGGTLALTGKDFRDGATVIINGVPSTKVTVAMDKASATADFSGPFVPTGPYDVTFQNPDGCSATLAQIMRVTPGPSILFVDPPAVPSAISTQVTVYGSGVTPPISKVEISPTGKATYTPLTFRTVPSFPNRVLANIPAGLSEGTYDMRLTDQTANCPAYLAGAMKIVGAASLTVSTVTPGFGSTAQDTAILIGGAGFVASPRVYLNPTGNPPGSIASALAGVTFQAATSLTGVVRKGLTAGLYDLLVVNPDGTYGLKTMAFRVTDAASPPPVITSIAPSSVVTGVATTLAVFGTGFRAGATATLSCQDAAGAATAGASASVTNVTATQVTISATGTGVLCIVRITNSDGTFFDYSAIGVTNSSLNLTGFKAGTNLTTARRAPGASAGRPTPVARYVYVVGGDNGADAGAMSTVESAPTSLDGTLGTFTVQSQRLPANRSFISVVNHGRFLYAVGGFDGTKAAKEVYRAEILNPLSGPQITDVDVKFDRTVGLDAGTYIYRVSAVLNSSDAVEANNPGGETLAGDAFPLRLPTVAGGKLQLTLLWTAIPNAASYRIYRSVKAGDPAGSERLIATVAAVANPQYLDNGTMTPQGQGPLPLGSTGAWRTLPLMNTARISAGVAVAADPMTAGRFYLYVAGGNSGTLAAPTAVNSVEFLPITVDASGNQAIGTWTNATQSLLSARWAAPAIAGTSANNSKISGNQTYLYVASGTAGALSANDDRIDAALVQAGGQLAAFADARGAGGGIKRSGAGMALVNNIFMAFGGFSGGTAVNNSVSANLGTAPGLTNFNSLGSGGLNVARALQGTALESAFIYQIGGASGAIGTAQATTEQTIW